LVYLIYLFNPFFNYNEIKKKSNGKFWVAGGGDERERNKTQKKKAKIVNQTNWNVFGKRERNTEKKKP